MSNTRVTYYSNASLLDTIAVAHEGRYCGFEDAEAYYAELYPSDEMTT